MAETAKTKSFMLWYVLLFLAVAICLVIPLGLLVTLGFAEGIGELFKTNQPPIAALQITPLNGTTKTLFTFDAKACSDPEDAPDSLNVRWDLDNDGKFEQAWSTTKKLTRKYDQAGTYTIQVEVKDTKGKTAKASAKISVEKIINTRPTAVLKYTQNQKKFLEFVFDASQCIDKEQNLQQLQVRWDFNGDGTWDTPYSAEKKVTHIFKDYGSYDIILEVKDTEGLTHSVSTSIRNVVPEIMYSTHKDIRDLNRCSECHYPFAAEAPCEYAAANPKCDDCHRFQEKP